MARTNPGGGRTVNLGRFDTRVEAHLAYREAALRQRIMTEIAATRFDAWIRRQVAETGSHTESV
jgi:hypothetical protein